VNAIASIGIFVGVLLALIVWSLVRTRRDPGGNGEVKRLRARYIREVGLPPDHAYGSLERHLERLMKENPGRSMEWYLGYILAELKRDRR
jgi:hypothetical protein